MIKSTKAAAVVAAAALLLTACSSSTTGASSTTTTTTSAAGKDCPTTTLTGTPPEGQQGQQGQQGSLGAATSIKPADTANSTVLDPTGPQIQCGKVELTSHKDVVYATPTTAGKQVELKMDIQAPATGGAKPLVIYLPGGGFMNVSLDDNIGQRTYVAEQGYVVVAIEYRTESDGAIYSDAVQDVKSAIAFLRQHATEYGIDPTKIAVWGQSSGGYMAAMTGVSDSGVQAVIDQFGPSNLSKTGDDFDDAAKAANVAAGNNLAKWVYGPDTTKSTAEYTPEVAAADPSTHVTSSTPPFLLLHGTADALVSPSQTLLVADALKAKGVPFTRYLVQGANHGDLSFVSDSGATKYWTTVTVVSKITDFLKQRLG
ncbi:prolyl oligopeptidase family serine peptidase [Kutzneria sp. NPDC052558]|uniref:prolyl oligopeptidase family serine peptidase n=1 Tax=Kutzneria sp. NPDC052558 TaxID=3364121 RepID=UPI0037C5A3AF